MNKKTTVFVRIRKDLKTKIEEQLPNMEWNQRIGVMYDTSIIKQKDKFGRILYGKSIWNKWVKKMPWKRKK